MLKLHDDGNTVELYDPHRHSAPVRVAWRDWVDLMARSVHAVRVAMNTPISEVTPGMYQDAREGALWLTTNGIQTENDFLNFEKRLPELLAPPDPSRLVHCSKCSRVLTDKLSKALGIGPSCRMKTIPVRLAQSHTKRVAMGGVA